jgi:hyaluronoglucosaminidase
MTENGKRITGTDNPQPMPVRFHRRLLAAALMLCLGCGDGGHGDSAPAPGMIGMIESFYGPPYAFEARLDLLRFLKRAGLNAYLYAPKNDPYHRDRWREPYPPEWMDHFAELARVGRELGVRFVFALSPGTRFEPDGGDFDAIEAKLGAMLDAGVRDFCILFDDLDPHSRAAEPDLQVRIVNASHAFLRGRDPDSRLCFISHYYAGSAEEMRDDRAPFNSSFAIPSSAAYRAYAAIASEIPILWTGRRVFASTLTAADVADFQSFAARPLLIWDNYPVNDILLSRELFLAPYREREAGITAAAAGVLLNTMLQPEASKIALWTAGRFFAEGEAYDPEAALDEALEVVAGSQAGARVLALLADQFRSHPFIGDQPESTALTARAEAFFRTRSQADEQALRALLQAFVTVEDDLARELENPRLVVELGEPAHKLSLYGTAGLLGLDALAAQARGEPADVEPLRALLAEAAAIPWLVGANTRFGPPLDDFLGGRPAVPANAFGDFFAHLLALL